MTTTVASGSLFGVALLLTLSACGADGADRGPTSFLQRDSAGITIAETPGADAFAPLCWSVDSIPSLVIGDADSPGHQLHLVQGVKGLANGGVLVVDGGSDELRFFDAQGRLRRRVGRSGEGPGEFLDPVLVPQVDSDSLLIFDKWNQRLQIFSPNGAGHRTRELPEDWGGRRRPPIGAVGGQVLFQSTLGWRFESEINKPNPGMISVPWNYGWSDLVAGEKSVFTSVVTDLQYRTADPSDNLMNIPFYRLAAAGVTEHGALISDGRTWEIRGYDLGGELDRILRVRASGRPVTPEMLELRLELRVAIGASRDRLEREYATVPIPDTLPAFESLQVDEEGWIWAKVYAWDPDEPSEWVVFGPKGRAHGVVHTPAGLEVQSIGRDHVLGIWRDQFDVEHVHRYALERHDPPHPQLRAPGADCRSGVR